MNKTIQLVNEWGAYEQNHPDADIEEFCRFYLTAQRAQREVGEPFGGGPIPPTTHSFLSKLMGSICRAIGFYFEKAFVVIPEIRQKEDFYFLSNIASKGVCRKTEVIHEQLLGLTTGIDTLNRLLAAELISERPDPTDKRAKLLSLTFKGRDVLQRCYEVSKKVTEMVFCDLSEEDIKLCIQLLRGVETRHSSQIHDMKDKSFEEIYQLMLAQKQHEPPR
jgi:DNA-binding MarR family transcriptional regulator